MDQITLRVILTDELGYSDYEASVTTTDLLNLHPSLKYALEKWVSDRTETDVSVDEFSALALMKGKRLTYPAALIALDWLITDPTVARKQLTSDIIHL